MIRKIDDEWAVATEGTRTSQRLVLARDRNDPQHYFSVVFFDSYESAMENSALPETQTAAEKYMATVEGPVTFHDLDIIEDHS